MSFKSKTGNNKENSIFHDAMSSQTYVESDRRFSHMVGKQTESYTPIAITIATQTLDATSKADKTRGLQFRGETQMSFCSISRSM